MVRADAETRAQLRWSTLDDEMTLPGLAERVTHPEFAGIEFLHVRARSLINHVPRAAGMPFEWTINAYRGCTHACTYCFARPTHAYLDLGTGEDFERKIVVKVNAVARLRAELAAPRWRGDHIALGTNTDPYQRCEGRYRLTRGIVETLTSAGNPFSVLTKGTLALRDLDVFEIAATRCDTTVSFSIPTLDEHAWKLSEPGTPHPRSRMEAVAALNAAGVSSGVMVAPIIPGFTDAPSQLTEVVKAAIAADAVSVTPIVLHLRPGVREVFLPWIDQTRPDLRPELDRLYRRSYAPSDERRRIHHLVRRLVERHAPPGHPLRRPRPPRGIGRRVDTDPAAETARPEQLGFGV